MAFFLVMTVLHNEISSDTPSVTAPAFASIAEPDTSPANSLLLKSDQLNDSFEYDKVPPQPPAQDDGIVELFGSIEPGDTLEASLRRLSLSTKIIRQILTSLQSHLDYRRLAPEDTYTVTLNNQGELVSYVYEAGPLEIYHLAVKDGRAIVEKNAIALVNKTIKISGTIDSSLFASVARLGEQPSLVYAFADIFSSKIDFNTESRQGDKFRLVVDKYYKGDDFIGYGKIQAASYVMMNGKKLDAYYFPMEKGIGAYFDREGKEVGTSFLRSPVPMGRVTSKFTYSRKHPITGEFKPHLGIDLAAPIGTPILAASDGKVLSIGRKGANGRQIILSHNGGIKTYYGHLARYKKGLKKGSLVNKKEVIGYVGSSGLSTGPHLDYRISKNGIFKNPFSMEFAPKSELSGNELALFKKEASSFENILSAILSTPDNIVQVKNFTLDPDRKLILL
jgi:murein DD-endopeptidase MepM/ murein hydrolase activator NlpD